MYVLSGTGILTKFLLNLVMIITNYVYILGQIYRILLTENVQILYKENEGIVLVGFIGGVGSHHRFREHLNLVLK
jgi:hypothetical protein